MPPFHSFLNLTSEGADSHPVLMLSPETTAWCYVSCGTRGRETSSLQCGLTTQMLTFGLLVSTANPAVKQWRCYNGKALIPLTYNILSHIQGLDPDLIFFFFFFWQTEPQCFCSFWPKSTLRMMSLLSCLLWVNPLTGADSSGPACSGMRGMRAESPLKGHRKRVDRLCYWGVKCHNQCVGHRHFRNAQTKQEWRLCCQCRLEKWEKVIKIMQPVLHAARSTSHISNNPSSESQQTGARSFASSQFSSEVPRMQHSSWENGTHHLSTKTTSRSVHTAPVNKNTAHCVPEALVFSEAPVTHTNSTQNRDVKCFRKCSTHNPA